MLEVFEAYLDIKNKGIYDASAYMAKQIGQNKVSLKQPANLQVQTVAATLLAAI